MKQFGGLGLIGVGKFLAVRSATTRGLPLPNAAKFSEHMKELADRLSETGLSTSSAIIRNLGTSLAAGGVTDTEFKKQVEFADFTIMHEVRNVLFLWVPAYRSDYFTKPQLFGELVAQRFPNASDEIEQAGKCYALARYTASVFHLMRVVEVGLGALKQEVGIRRWHSTWNAAIGQIRGKLKTGRKGKPLSKRERARNEFLQGATSYIEGMSVAWRNPTMHRVERTYTEEEALEVFNAVKAFTGHLAKRLRQPQTAGGR